MFNFTKNVTAGQNFVRPAGPAAGILTFLQATSLDCQKGLFVRLTDLKQAFLMGFIKAKL